MWMSAMQKTSMEEKMEEVKVVAKKLPEANLLLLKKLLTPLQHIRRMSSNNLATCIGPNLLSPPKEELLPLEAMLEVTQKARCLDQLTAAFPAHRSLAARSSLDNFSPLEPTLVGWQPHSHSILRRGQAQEPERLLGAFQAAGLKQRL
ncbi:T-cell activation Rho GTPase-activating protein-like [Patagioenas fasciata]|uniref:T-cell activation Rho GTPase-activating protein-like n=1 Tax=Patagioenas fasciata TaxID=372321 RepID=UPI003A99E16E